VILVASRYASGTCKQERWREITRITARIRNSYVHVSQFPADVSVRKRIRARSAGLAYVSIHCGERGAVRAATFRRYVNSVYGPDFFDTVGGEIGMRVAAYRAALSSRCDPERTFRVRASCDFLLAAESVRFLIQRVAKSTAAEGSLSHRSLIAVDAPLGYSRCITAGQALQAGSNERNVEYRALLRPPGIPLTTPDVADFARCGANSRRR
jgi:hypothetical protein